MLPYGSESRALKTIRVAHKSHEFSWKQLAVSASLTVAGLGYCATLHSLMAQQSAALASIQAQINGASSLSSVQAVKPHTKAIKISAALDTPLPHKFALQHVTPRKTQDMRGTCWDFATVSVLEYTYRQQGIANGWLAPDTYVSLSEQAYGAEVLRLCTSVDKVKCYSTAAANSTEGGWVAELAMLAKDIAIFPEAICPYEVNPGNDATCAGVTPATKSNNPLKVSVNKLTTYIDPIDIKRALVTDQRAMALTSTLAELTHYQPCVGELTKDPRCDVTSSQCTTCPPNSFQTACCIPVKGGNDYNLDGEFISHYGMDYEGGHVMTFVGYNDAFRTQDGATGGYILKNSWWDGADPALGPKNVHGSHSIRYWLQDIQAFEERFSCPNSANPNNWYSCQGSVGVIKTKQQGFGGPIAQKVQVNATGDLCLLEETRQDAIANISPLHLNCLDKSGQLCTPGLTYFTRNLTLVGDHFNVLCLFEYNKTGVSHDLCLPPMLIKDIAHTLQPVADELRENDPDLCGFYFFPYEKQLAQFERGWELNVDNLDVTWAPQSYAANAAKFPHLDYSLVRNSTKKQKLPVHAPPFPLAALKQ
ncbi:Aste57867_1416 [Aphanomyces stellatus]|uniref:Aste57867_1416 protein n=1 Tax=Aphanomyces stellatus TaxID=120398 RepID=A0A485K586_9STRA|nr:hypothetical protein As57867_001415 [Aphanomyces stellatus]VFT78633.1 Aste57867_1416 [Aphanomyces stellatus]